MRLDTLARLHTLSDLIHQNPKADAERILDLLDSLVHLLIRDEELSRRAEHVLPDLEEDFRAATPWR